MNTYIVTRKSDGAEVYRYSAESAIEWQGFEFATHDHIAEVAPAVAEVTVPVEAKISIGSFFDRFGAAKLPILASTDPIVQALIKDASVRKHIDLAARREELLGAMALLRSKGFDVGDSVVTAPVSDEERP